VGFTPANDLDDRAMSELAGNGGRRTAGASSHDRKIEGDEARRAPACALVIFEKDAHDDQGSQTANWLADLKAETWSLTRGSSNADVRERASRLARDI
jgi:hypothetical protein